MNTGRASNTGRGSDIIVLIEAGGFYSRKCGNLLNFHNLITSLCHFTLNESLYFCCTAVLSDTTLYKARGFTSTMASAFISCSQRNCRRLCLARLLTLPHVPMDCASPVNSRHLSVTLAKCVQWHRRNFVGVMLVELKFKHLFMGRIYVPDYIWIRWMF